ncbi:CidA/LrgA family protein [Myroides sp. LJL116]
MNIIKQLVIIAGCLAFGELVIKVLPLKLPSSIIGLLLLWTLLKMQWVKVKDIEQLSSFLLQNMGLFFVPPCVAMLNYFDLISDSIIPILLTTVGSTAVVMFTTGLTHQILRKKK